MVRQNLWKWKYQQWLVCLSARLGYLLHESGWCHAAGPGVGLGTAGAAPSPHGGPEATAFHLHSRVHCTKPGGKSRQRPDRDKGWTGQWLIAEPWAAALDKVRLLGHPTCFYPINLKLFKSVLSNWYSSSRCNHSYIWKNNLKTWKCGVLCFM